MSTRTANPRLGEISAQGPRQADDRMRRRALRRQATSPRSSAPTIPVPRRGPSSVPACAKTRCHLRYWTLKKWEFYVASDLTRAFLFALGLLTAIALMRTQWDCARFR